LSTMRYLKSPPPTMSAISNPPDVPSMPAAKELVLDEDRG